MDKLDRLLAQLDQEVADAQGALAGLARVRGHDNPSDHVLHVSLWRRGAKGQLVAHVTYPEEVQGSTAHAQLAERHAIQCTADAGRRIQQALAPLAAFLGEGPNLRRLQAWPAFHLMVGPGGTHALLSLTGSAPPRVAFGATWSWKHQVFHNACRVFLDHRTGFGVGDTWTLTHHVDSRPSAVCQAKDRETALVLLALRKHPEILDPDSNGPFVLSRVEANVDSAVCALRGPARRSNRRHVPRF
jgi:hypothetical protein